MNDIASRQGDTQVLPPAAGPPRPARAEAWSRRGPRRKARREFRPRRSVPGVLVAAVLAAAGILGAVQAASAALDRPLWKLPHRYFAGPLQDTHWDGTATLAVAAAVAFIGLLLVLTGLIPGRPRAIPLASGDESVVIGAPRRSLRRSLARLAEDVDGIDRARAKARMRSVTGARHHPAARHCRPARERAYCRSGPSRRARPALAAAGQGPATPQSRRIAMTRHTARVSRAGLILTGLILLAGGGAALARSLGAFPTVLGRSTAPLLSHAQTRYPTGHAWVWPVAAVAAAVIALLALWWLAAQTRTTYRAPPVPRTRPHPRGHGSARRTQPSARSPTNSEATPASSGPALPCKDPRQRPGCNCQSPQKTTPTPPSCAPASKPRPSLTCAPPSNSTPSPPCCASGSARAHNRHLA